MPVRLPALGSVLKPFFLRFQPGPVGELVEEVRFSFQAMGKRSMLWFGEALKVFDDGCNESP